MARLLRPTILVTTAVAVTVTVVVSVADVEVAYRAPEGHVAVETAGALIALLVAFIVLGRFLQSARLGDLLLAAALATIGLSNLFFAVLPAAAGAPFTRWTTWALIAGRLLGAFGFAAAALVPDRRLRDPRAALRRVSLLVGSLLVIAAIVFGRIGPHLPLGIDPAMSPTEMGLVVGDAGVLAVQLLAFVLYSAATVGFLVRSERTDDRLLGWVALASTFAALAWLNYFLFPSLYTEWVFTGDLLRIAFFVLLLLGAASEIQHYQASLADAAALEERRRLARELHDGLAQELAFIATQSRYLARGSASPEMVEALTVAAERALDESRSAISALTRPLDEPLDDAVAQAAEDVAGRVGVRLRLDLEEGIDVPASTRAALVRIVREAVSNTARHGHAKLVTVALSGGDAVRLSVADDGIGFNPDDREGRGFGLTSMSERAHALGGELHVTSTPGSGTQVEVVLP